MYGKYFADENVLWSVYVLVRCLFTGHILQRFDPSYMTYHSPLVWGKVAMEEMAIINIFVHVLINGRFVGYMLAGHS